MYGDTQGGARITYAWLYRALNINLTILACSVVAVVAVGIYNDSSFRYVLKNLALLLALFIVGVFLQALAPGVFSV
jgi:hypothetical protein